jgi:ectoine hydroxylase-related dioxygenase (phytanoyl-CoA dioxygenase family)
MTVEPSEGKSPPRNPAEPSVRFLDLPTTTASRNIESCVETRTVNTIEEALESLGVSERTLAAFERTALDRDGYLVLPQVLDGDVLARLREAFETVFAEQHAATGAAPSGTRHVGDLVHRNPLFEGVCTHARILAAVHHVLRRPFRVFQLSGRDPLPGYGGQGLHNDWLPRAPSQPFNFVTAIWLLDAFTAKNGATRLIPGSHLLPRGLPKNMMVPASHHPEERIVVADAGSVLVFNGHLWHSATRNDSDLSRRVLQCQFAARELPRIAGLRHDAPNALDPATRYILDA